LRDRYNIKKMFGHSLLPIKQLFCNLTSLHISKTIG
jgi:hypothetical protein